MFGSPETWPVSWRQLAALTDLMEAGDIQSPMIAEVGGLSVETVRRAHTMLETRHVQGKLVMLVG
jgi:NADPH:quinone reductase-like Zn-dependent oxidoreductase